MHSVRKPEKRRRTDNAGCTRCRASHHKCDEKQPRCGRCQRLNLECEPANFIVASNWCQFATDPSGLKDERPGPASTWDVFNNSLAPLPQAFSRNAPRPDSESPLPLDAEKVTLIQAYQNGVGAWMDLFDDEANFQRTVVKRALRSPLLMSAICVLTARHITMVDEGGEVWKPVAVQYYGDSLRQLIGSLDCPTSCPEDTLAATILLSSYELLASPGLDHRRHVSGALTLIRTHRCRASSEGLMAAAFWVYARQDIAMALVHECPTLLPPDEWGVSWDEQDTREGRLGNQMVWLLARVIAHTFQSTTGQSVLALSEGRAGLIKELDVWHERLPESFRGTAFGPPLEEGFLPRWFAVPSTGKESPQYPLNLE
ncbi:hypothetical protein CNMCM6936_006770 [Aspergillus lentulus]|nr:hypothetical protein CNMCM6936_006770 [Aspergillus lentulus]KAF4170635.1 hypothetical protein CNMCM8060_004668 [Aspergillus lentulus]KAF4176191.1 hypothetical protein CNMCM7927_004320 [Aspergillus lentulus]KAF4188777.1 hypothetical protein CNMCM8694_004532 [Aspergillus lentulus]GFF97361.1 hypothetical protein IFM47457_11352 [Aspergillus lentulus]